MEETPAFDAAVERLRAFLSERGWPTNLVWRKHIDLVHLRDGEIVVRRRSEPAASRAARAHYESGLRRGVGIALEVLCELNGAACASLRWSSDRTEQEYAMLPDRGLKLSVVTTRRTGRSVGILAWWLARRRAKLLDAALRRSFGGGFGHFELCGEVNTIDLNQALRIYLGSNVSGGVTPYGGDDRVRASYGRKSPEVLAEIRQLIDGLFKDEEVANLPSLAEIGAFVETRARSKRPDLEGDVCRAIGNYVSYSYR